jgi:HEAT repeat protein
MILLRRLWLLVVFCLLCARPALAGKVEDLSRMLLEDSSYKVRLQAALLLGKLGDRAASPALIKALGDENRTVRAMAAQSLGRLGVADGAPALKGLLQRERDPFVRAQAEKALASLGPAPDGGRGKARIYLTFGSFGGGSKLADTTLLDALRAALRRELTKLTGVTFTLDSGEEKSFGKSGRLGFLIDGNVTRLDDGLVGGAVEINCDVKVMVARWPSKSIILWTNAGAAVQSGARERDKESARRDCLEASAGQLGEDLGKFFQSQGG